VGPAAGACLFLAALGLVLAERVGWRLGLLVLAAGLLLGAACRLLLPTANTGTLAVRHRAVDVLVLAVLGVGVGVLALIISDGGPPR
jgi:hypothetical protein